MQSPKPRPPNANPPNFPQRRIVVVEEEELESGDIIVRELEEITLRDIWRSLAFIEVVLAVAVIATLLFEVLVLSEVMGISKAVARDPERAGVVRAVEEKERGN